MPPPEKGGKATYAVGSLRGVRGRTGLVSGHKRLWSFSPHPPHSVSLYLKFRAAAERLAKSCVHAESLPSL